jgi:hypothetical protein
MSLENGKEIMKSVIDSSFKQEIFSSILNLLLNTDPPFRTCTTREMCRLMRKCCIPNEIEKNQRKEIFNNLGEIIFKIKSMGKDEILCKILFDIFEE